MKPVAGVSENAVSFWSGVTLTGNETKLPQYHEGIGFWSGVTLTGNETIHACKERPCTFWSGVTLTGNETPQRSVGL